MSVARIAVPGAIVPDRRCHPDGRGPRPACWAGRGTTGLVFGLALSVASTVVMIRALQDRHILETERGRIAVGWLVVEDLVMILTLVLLPTAAAMVTSNDGVPLSRLAFQLLVTLVKVGIFVTVMLVVGRRVIPWLMHYTAHTGSRELFRLAVYAIALGVAFGAAKLFDVSFALGAFFAGMVMGESTLSQQATEEAIAAARRLRRAVLRLGRHAAQPGGLHRCAAGAAATVAIIVVGKAAVAWVIVRAFRLGPMPRRSPSRPAGPRSASSPSS